MRTDDGAVQLSRGAVASCEPGVVELRLPIHHAMKNWPNLSKAPIVEGLIDLRVERSADVSVASLLAASEDWAAEFPSRQERRSVMAQFNVEPAGTMTSSASVASDGVVLRSADERWVVQLRLDGFTVSRLSPYSSWEELLAKTLEIWQRYHAVAKPLKIDRVATRFINRVPLIPEEAFDRTFLTTFALGPQLPQSVAAYLLRVVVPCEEGVMAVLTQSLEGDVPDCMLDIDVFSAREAGFSSADAWQQLEVLRGVKNRLFFGSLTPDSLERFK